LRTEAWGARGRDRLGKTRRRPHLVLVLGVDNDGQHKGRYSQREHEVLKPAIVAKIGARGTRRRGQSQDGELLPHTRPEHRLKHASIQRSLHRLLSPTSPFRVFSMFEKKKTLEGSFNSRCMGQ